MQIIIPCAIAPLLAKVSIPGSKSITNRALLLAALAEGDSFLQNVLFSDDTLTLIAALRELGVVIEVDEDQCAIKIVGCSGRFPQSRATINCRDAGTVARFLLVACANQLGEFTFEGSARLSERPLSDLIHVLRQQGAEISSSSLPFVMRNNDGLLGGVIDISGDISSQFLSGLLISAPYFKTDVILNTKNLTSEPYVAMTCAMMRDFGVAVCSVFRERTSMYSALHSIHGRGVPQNVADGHREFSWEVKVGEKYHGRNYWIESDFSSASYFFAAAAVTGGKVTVLNMVRETSIQGDSEFLTVLEKMGCDVISNDEGITVIGPLQLKGIEVDMQHISDTMMTLAAIAPFADSPTRITNIGNTRVKESDRIAAMANNLRQLNIHVDEEKTALTIYPGTPSSGIIRTYQDHRIAMACALIGLKVPGIVIDDASCASKTFPDFFKVFFSVVSSS